MTTSDEHLLPWYRQFWFWFIFGPLIFIICLCFFTVGLAFRYSDDVVTDNYYKEGVMINQIRHQDERALALNLSALIKYDLLTGEVLVSIRNAEKLPAQLVLYMDHPVKKTKDQYLILQKTAVGEYRADLISPPEFFWYLVLVPELDVKKRTKVEWSLSGSIDFAKSSEAFLQPRAK